MTHTAESIPGYLELLANMVNNGNPEAQRVYTQIFGEPKEDYVSLHLAIAMEKNGFPSDLIEPAVVSALRGNAPQWM
ncbi:MAG: hypothetical protein Q7S76_00770 [bacterium]|nr:hypothetical protein [bacterium]